jgi:uncharacterized protein YhhL (DUF1145 family)
MSLTAKKILVNIVILILVLLSGIAMILLKETTEKTFNTTNQKAPIHNSIE